MYLIKSGDAGPTESSVLDTMRSSGLNLCSSAYMSDIFTEPNEGRTSSVPKMCLRLQLAEGEAKSHSKLRT